MNPRPHKRLLAWQRAVDMVYRIYEITRGFPREELYGITTQLRKAAVSVPSNMAEGLSRRSKKDKLHFLNVSQSSLSEIDTQFEISRRLRYVDDENFNLIEGVLVEVQMLLSGLIRSIKMNN